MKNLEDYKKAIEKKWNCKVEHIVESVGDTLGFVVSFERDSFFTGVEKQMQITAVYFDTKTVEGWAAKSDLLR